jgi:hypothetical protein
VCPASIAKFLGRKPDLVNEIRATLGAPCCFVVYATAGNGTPQLRGDMLGCRVAKQSRQQPSHTFHRIESVLGDIVALASRRRLVIGPLFRVLCSLFRSSFHVSVVVLVRASVAANANNESNEAENPEQGTPAEPLASATSARRAGLIIANAYQFR